MVKSSNDFTVAVTRFHTDSPSGNDGDLSNFSNCSNVNISYLFLPVCHTIQYTLLISLHNVCCHQLVTKILMY
jgi:hypothetical protein